MDYFQAVHDSVESGVIDIVGHLEYSAEPTAKDTTVCFSMPGTYVLRLTVSDGALSGSDDVNITVTPIDGAKVLNAVNAGGASYADAQGLV